MSLEPIGDSLALHLYEPFNRPLRADMANLQQSKEKCIRSHKNLACS